MHDTVNQDWAASVHGHQGTKVQRVRKGNNTQGTTELGRNLYYHRIDWQII